MSDAKPTYRDPKEIIAVAIEKYFPNIALACSFQSEEAVLIDMIMKVNKDVTIFALDTGRLNEETLKVAEEIREKYGCGIRLFFPDKDAVQKLVSEKGFYSFYDSEENRKECCNIRKVEPIGRAIKELGLKAMITGLRQEHSPNRQSLPQIQEPGSDGGLVKINPIVHWSTQETWDYINAFNLPINELYKKGYRSIGCECCTRASRPGEDDRAGRWWWEDSKKECGLHKEN